MRVILIPANAPLSMAIASAAFMAFPMICYAGVGIDSNIGNTVCEIFAYTQGNLGKALATLSIIILGMGAMFGRVSWGMAATVAVGVSITFGSYGILNIMWPDNNWCGPQLVRQLVPLPAS